MEIRTTSSRFTSSTARVHCGAWRGGGVAARGAGVPIVFAGVSDPVGDGLVASLPRPGGNITGFVSQEAGMVGKWLDLLTEIAPTVRRVAIMFNPDMAPDRGSYYLPSFEAAARSLKVEPIAAPVHADDLAIVHFRDTAP
jgi:ABC-type uncharacterized transport system substrate-binding protein